MVYSTDNFILRSDWETNEISVSVAAIRWRQSKAWGKGALRFLRDAAWELAVAEDAHLRLMAILATVRSVDALVQDMATDLHSGRTSWDGGCAAPIMKQVHEGLRGSGAAEGGPLWVAADRAAARSLQKRRDRWKGYGWLKPFRPGDIVETIRLPFGSYYAAPLVEADGGLTDNLLLGRFMVAPLPGKPPAPRFRPVECTYAEAALLQKGWRIRFVKAEDQGG